MTIETTDIIWRLAQVNNKTSSNGGRMTKQVATTKFPTIFQPERLAGGTFYSKRYAHTAIADNTGMVNAFLYNFIPTSSGDRMSLFLGTQTDTQGDLTGSERRYGTGYLDANVTIGATSIDVAVESAADNTFQIGDTIKIFHKEWDSLNSTYVELLSERVVVTDKTAVGDVITLEFTTPLQNDFDKIETWSGGRLIEFTGVSSLVPVGSVSASFSSFVVTSGSGAYDEVNYPIVLQGLSTIEQNWTLTFTSTTAFSITGDTLGLLGTGGTVSSGAAPINPDYSQPYFTLVSAGFSGSFAINDTIEFTTKPHSIPIWLRQDVPASTASFSDVVWGLALECEVA